MGIRFARQIFGWLIGDREYAGWAAIEDRGRKYVALRAANETFLRDLEKKDVI